MTLDELKVLCQLHDIELHEYKQQANKRLMRMAGDRISWVIIIETNGIVRISFLECHLESYERRLQQYPFMAGIERHHDT